MIVAPLLLALALAPQDPIRVGARLTEAEIRTDETTILRVDAQTEGSRARIRPIPSLPPGIRVVSTRDYDQRQFSMPGGTRRFITREYVLRAAAPGRYRIPSVEVEIDGDVYTTQSLLLTVTSGPATVRGDAVAGGDDGVALRAWLDADTVFVGEQVTLLVDAMFSQNARMRLRRAPEYEPPSPSGFWVHELPDAGRPVSRNVGGQVFEVQRFRRAFFPLAAGEYEIPPARLEYEMSRGLLASPETREVSSQPIPLVVLPVPADAPPAFTGAVGEYRIRGRVEPATVPVGEAAVLTVEIEGTGNVKALPAPALPELPGVDVFPPSEESETATVGTTLQGSKTFSWVLIPRQAGQLEIPAIRYAYFDPDAGGFETASVAPLTVTATPAESVSGPVETTAIRFLKTGPEGDGLRWVRSSWFTAAQALPLLLFALALVWRRRSGRASSTTPRSLRRERAQGIRALEDRIDHPTDFFAEAEAFARRWVARRLGGAVRPSVGPREWTEAGVPADAAETLRAALARVSAGRYAPESPGESERRAILDALARALEEVDASAPAPEPAGERPGKGGGGVRAGIVVLMTFTAAAGLDAQATGADIGGSEAGPAEQFEEGLEAFQNARYMEAARAFDRYTTRAPLDPAGWYNLGTAYHQAGYGGLSVWAWLRALQRDPRDADTRHNLRAAGTPPELVRRVAPAVPLGPEERLALAALLWLVAGLAGSLWIARGGRRAGATAVVSLVLALALAAVHWTAVRGPGTVVVLESTALRAGPALQADAVTSVQPGAGLVPVDRHGDWLRARTLWGDEGWIENTVVGEL